MKLGTHVNGVGPYLPHMHEVDITTITRASKIVVDDFAGVKDEAGELMYAEEIIFLNVLELHILIWLWQKMFTQKRSNNK